MKLVRPLVIGITIRKPEEIRLVRAAIDRLGVRPASFARDLLLRAARGVIGAPKETPRS